MDTANEYPPFVTVLRSCDKFYPAIMEWDKIQERYALSVGYKKKSLHTDAEINAQALAEKMGLEYRP